MSLHEALSVNLARLCEGKGSIAAVCRATQINRQQFNRYLSGETVPNKRNREKICRYFGIAERELFIEPAEETGSRTGDPTGSWSHREMRAAMKLIYSEPPLSIRPGIYFTYFAIPQDQTSIMRSVLVIRNDGGLTTFRRLTGFSEPHGSWWSHFTGDHKGIVIERLHWALFRRAELAWHARTQHARAPLAADFGADARRSGHDHDAHRSVGDRGCSHPLRQVDELHGCGEGVTRFFHE